MYEKAIVDCDAESGGNEPARRDAAAAQRKASSLYPDGAVKHGRARPTRNGRPHAPPAGAGVHVEQPVGGGRGADHARPQSGPGGRAGTGLRESDGRARTGSDDRPGALRRRGHAVEPVDERPRSVFERCGPRQSRDGGRHAQGDSLAPGRERFRQAGVGRIIRAAAGTNGPGHPGRTGGAGIAVCGRADRRVSIRPRAGQISLRAGDQPGDSTSPTGRT